MKKVYNIEHNYLLKKILNDEIDIFKTPRYCTKIAAYRFYNKLNLKEALLVNITSIDDSAFYNCPNLQTITLDSSLTKVGPLSFANCKNLSKIYYNGTVEQWKNVSYKTENLINSFKNIIATEIQCIDGNVSI